MMQRSHSRLSYYRIHFVHSYLSTYLHSCQDLNDCCDSPLVHVVLGVVQPHAHLHGVTLPDEVEDVLHGEAAVVPCISPVSPLSGPAPGVSQSLLGVGAPRCAAAQPCPAATSPKLDSLDSARLSPLSSSSRHLCGSGSISSLLHSPGHGDLV